MGDALQLRYRTGDLFSEREISIEVRDEQNTRLVFPISLVERADTFDALMSDIAEYIEADDDPLLALDDHAIANPHERATLESTVAILQRLRQEGRDHIWAYYTRNMVRPVALSRSKVDVIIGNPPWLNYRNTADTLRSALEQQSTNLYGIWVGGNYATQQDVAGLFFARSVDLYLKTGGVIGMVMPHSALQAGQYRKWRTGKWQSPQKTQTLSVDLGFKTPWDLETLEPNYFFPVAASVVFAWNLGLAGNAKPLSGTAERWFGHPGAHDVLRISCPIGGTSSGSTYREHSRQGATIVPRCLFFVSKTENPADVHTGQTITVNPRRGSQDKKPWKEPNLDAISGQTIEENHLFDIHLGETVAPFVTLEPLQALLPLKQGEFVIPADDDSPGGINPGGLERRMRGRWRIISDLWETNRAQATRLNLLDQLDYMGKLSSQLEWQQNPDDRSIRLAYSTAGEPTAALLGSYEFVTERLYWVTCRSDDEANYLLAIINSDTLAEAVNKYTTPNWAGKTRDLHKHLWKLPIPEYDAANALHRQIAWAGETAAAGAAQKLAEVRERLEEEGKPVTVTVARRELRKWLRASDEGRAVEGAVGLLLR